MPDSPTSNHTTSESHESAIDWLRRIADSYVNELFDQYQPNPPRESRDGKVIRDPIHGFIHLSDLETAVLDSPLVQRLRYIHQNGFAYLVYPSAQHTRLDHSIGVMKVVDDVATSLRNDQCRKNQSSDKAELDDRDLTELRLAALLHDTGHGFLSHMSEELIERHWYDKFAAIRSADARFSGSGAAELLSYFLITSHGFKSYLTEASNRLRNSRITGRRTASFRFDRVASTWKRSGTAGQRRHWANGGLRSETAAASYTRSGVAPALLAQRPVCSTPTMPPSRLRDDRHGCGL